MVWARRHRAGLLPAAELSPLLRCLKPDDVFLDVGGHAGSWAIPASRVLPRGRVYSFEALPYYAGVLKTTLALLGRRNVTVVPAAVSEGEGEVSILWKDAQGQRLTGRTRMASGPEAGSTVRVRTTSIDRFREQQPDGRVRLIKCDVEGAELLVLRGAASTIARWRPLVFCELYDDYCRRFGYRAADVFAFFAERGYRPMRFESGAFVPMDGDMYGGWGDVLFVPAETDLSAACA